MRAVTVHEFSNPPGPAVSEAKPPEPSGGETLIEVIAAEIAPLDRQIAMGMLPGAGPLPIQPGATGVGRVRTSARFEPGQLVYVGGGDRSAWETAGREWPRSRSRYPTGPPCRSRRGWTRCWRRPA